MNRIEPLISVIVPVYNVEVYLSKCLDSVIYQTYSNLEIICINDCSTDNSLNILEEYAKKDQRIVILNNDENLGLGLSRNAGIRISKGEYIHCLDSDDWLVQNAYERLVYYINKVGHQDVFRFLYTCYHESENKYIDVLKGHLPDSVLNKTLNIHNYPQMIDNWEPTAWIKLIRADFLKQNELYYNDYRCLEDIEYSIKLLLIANSIYFIDEKLLYYRVRRGSLVTKRLLYYDNILKDAKSTAIWAKDLPELTQIYLLNYIYFHVLTNGLDLYYLSKISYKKLREIFVEYIDYDILLKYERFRYYAGIYKKILNYTELKFKFSYCFRRFLKENFPSLVEIYFKFKSLCRGIVR